LTTAFITHPDCLLHDMGGYHPEQPARLQAIEDQLIASGLGVHLRRYEAPLAQRTALERVHDAAYIDDIEFRAPAHGIVHLDPDTAMNPHTLHAALRGAGAAVLGTDLVVAGDVENAFCCVRPPGHHAERRRALGFCLFINVAVAAAHAHEADGLESVAVVDFDVHHGNGTEDIFSNDARVLMVSTFQHPFYPYSGADSNSGRMVNIPLAARSGGREFRAAVEEHWLPAIARFEPQMFFISAGFDAHADDDMAMLAFRETDYTWVTEVILECAQRHAGGRIVSVLEGGYALHALGRSATAHIKVLAGL